MGGHPVPSRSRGEERDHRHEGGRLRSEGSLVRSVLAGLVVLLFVLSSGCLASDPDGDDPDTAASNGTPSPGTIRLWTGSETGPLPVVDTFGCGVSGSIVRESIADRPVNVTAHWSITEATDGLGTEWVLGRSFSWASWPGQGPAGLGTPRPENDPYAEIIISEEARFNDTRSGTLASRDWDPQAFPSPGEYVGAFEITIRRTVSGGSCQQSALIDVYFVKEAVHVGTSASG